MPVAQITMDGLLGCQENLVIGTPVALANDDNAGVTVWLWTLLAAPEGSAAALDTPSASTCSFTPDLVGSYLVSLSINNGQDTDSCAGTVLTAPLPLAALAVGEDAANWPPKEQRNVARLGLAVGRHGESICRLTGAGEQGWMVYVASVGADGYPVALPATSARPAGAPTGVIRCGIDGETEIADGSLAWVVFDGLAEGVAVSGDAPALYDLLGLSGSQEALVKNASVIVARWLGSGIVAVGSSVFQQFSAAAGLLLQTDALGMATPSATALTDVARRAATPTAGHVATLDADGDPVDSGVVGANVAMKADTVALLSGAAAPTAGAGVAAAVGARYVQTGTPPVFWRKWGAADTEWETEATVTPSGWTWDYIVDAAGTGDFTSIHTAFTTGGAGKNYLILGGAYSENANPATPANSRIRFNGLATLTLGDGYFFTVNSAGTILEGKMKVVGKGKATDGLLVTYGATWSAISGGSGANFHMQVQSNASSATVSTSAITPFQNTSSCDVGMVEAVAGTIACGGTKNLVWFGLFNSIGGKIRIMATGLAVTSPASFAWIVYSNSAYGAHVVMDIDATSTGFTKGCEWASGANYNIVMGRCASGTTPFANGGTGNTALVKTT